MISSDILNNISNINCKDDSLTTREIFIILGFSIVIIIFITYQLVDFFELTRNDICYCFCKKKPEPRIRDIDREFSDMIEMEVVDRYGNLIFKKKAYKLIILLKQKE